MTKAEVREKLQFDLDQFDKHEDSPQTRFASFNQGLRADSSKHPERTLLAHRLLEDLHEVPDHGACARLVAGLDAAYTFSENLSAKSMDAQFDFHKHRNDWGDLMQLYYLCDVSVYFLTADTKIRPKLVHSPQALRVLHWEEFRSSISESSPSK